MRYNLPIMGQIYNDRWAIINNLSEGGQAFTYIVEDKLSPGKEFVLKRLKNINRIDRFENEINTIGKFDHPHIIPLIDYELTGEKPFFVTEFCQNGELKLEMIKDWSIAQKLQLFTTITNALAYAHEKGIVHRDIKPSNILFRSNGMAVVADFGICFSTDEGLERVTEFQEQVGSRYYMAPELADGRLDEVTPAADVYSLGKLLYWLLAGKLFDREKHTIEKWDLRDSDKEPLIHTIYDEIFAKTIVENVGDRFSNGTKLYEATKNVIETLEKEGRYLDADVPSSCLFCGIGKYVNKTIVPQLTQKPHNPNLQGLDSYDTNFSNIYGFASNNPGSMHAGNINSGSYQSFMILECGRCGNLQFFKMENDKTLWKNARPIK